MSKKHSSNKGHKRSQPVVVPPAELDKYCRRQRPVVVTNNTDTILMLSFADGPREHVVKVPNGSLLFCVSNYVPHQLIAASSSFRRLLAEGRVTLHDYHTVDMNQLVQAKTDSFRPDDDEEVSKNATVEITQEAIPASPQVGYLVASVDVEEMTPRDFLTRMETLKNTLTDRDLLHINDQLGHKYRKIREWATEFLADLREHHPKRCVSDQTDENGDETMQRKLARKGRKALSEAEADTSAFAADGEGESPKDKVKRMIAKNREGVGEVGTAKDRAKKLMAAQSAERAARRRHSTDL